MYVSLDDEVDGGDEDRPVLRIDPEDRVTGVGTVLKYKGLLRGPTASHGCIGGDDEDRRPGCLNLKITSSRWRRT